MTTTSASFNFPALAGNRTSFIPITGVEGWLTAACQLFGTFNRVPKPFEYARHADPYLREHQINEARNEQCDFQD